MSNPMRMMTEATIDDQFNKNLDDLQGAIERLEKIIGQFDDKKVRPVKSQLWALEIAAEDVKKLHDRLQNLAK